MGIIIIYLILIALAGLISYGISKLISYLILKLFTRNISFRIIFVPTWGITILLILLSLLTIKCGGPSHKTNDNYLDKLINYNYLDKLMRGKLAYDIPDTMEIKQNYKAIVSITRAMNDSVLFRDLDITSFTVEEINISSRVKVLLLDPTDNQNFKITPLNTEEQLVDDSTNTVWKWNIIPIKSGNNELVLRATVKILDDLGENYRDVTVFEKNIKVNASFTVTIIQFIGEYWQWLTTVCFIPLLLWGYRRFSERNVSTDKRKTLGFKKDHTYES